MMPSFLVVVVTLAILSTPWMGMTTAAAVTVSNAKISQEEELKYYSSDIDRCTTIVVGAKASFSGPMNTHTADCSDCDFRLNIIPAQDWPEGSMRPLYAIRGPYPNTVSPNRGKTWHPSNLEGTTEQLAAWGTESSVTGYVPQVPHTYSLYEAGYAIMNEHQVAIGESTCAARFYGVPVTYGGKAHIEINEMTRLGLERGKTAREAIQVMGDMAVKYGFYGSDWSGGEMSLAQAGEALTVIDKTEAWVFHVLCDDTGASAIWVAQRVPDDHVSAVANAFVIRHVNPHSSDFMFSPNIWDIAKRQGLWTESDGLLDFTAVYSRKRGHSAYSTRRVWRVYNIVAPSVSLPPDTDAFGSDYPFSIKVDKALSAQDVMQINRDHYEGTQFDMTKGIQSGPYGDPNRFDLAPVDNMTLLEVLDGSYERSISLFRTSYSFVTQARDHLPNALGILWYAPHAPSGSSYLPFFLGATEVPLAYMRGSLHRYDPSIAFWNFLSVANYAARFYRYAMVDVRAVQQSLMEKAIAAVEMTDKLVQAASTPGEIASICNKVVNDQASMIVTRWQLLLGELFTKYHDGYIAENLGQPDIHMRKLFYPKYWLDATGYWVNKPLSGPDIITFASNTEQMITITESNAKIAVTAIFFSALTCLLTLAGVFVYHKKQQLNHQQPTAIFIKHQQPQASSTGGGLEMVKGMFSRTLIGKSDYQPIDNI